MGFPLSRRPFSLPAALGRGLFVTVSFSEAFDLQHEALSKPGFTRGYEGKEERVSKRKAIYFTI